MVVVAHKVKLHKPLKRKFQKHAPIQNEDSEDEEMEATVDAEQNLSKDALIILQEINIARELGGNDPNKRNQQVRKLRRWLRLRTQSSFAFNEENFMRLWKGLYYCMYMADKPLYQEQLAENMGQLLHCFPAKIQLSIEFFGAFLNTMRNEWFGIDQWRMDKFYMLMRRMLRHMLKELRNDGWNAKNIQLFNEVAKKTVLAERGCALAMTMNFMDIIFEELAKVSEGGITAGEVNLFVQPFIDYLINQADIKLFAYCRSRIFHHLLFQSALGREYQDKYEAWKEMGFPASINDIEKVEAEKEEEEEEAAAEEEEHIVKPLDPRAGNVDVFVPELPLDGQPIVERLQQVITTMDMPAKRRKALRNLLQQFESYQKGEFPLGVKTMPRFEPERDTDLPLLEEKMEELTQTEEELYGVSRKLKKLNKRKRRLLLKTLNLKNVSVENIDKVIEKALPKLHKKDRLNQARHALMKGWIEEPVDDAAEMKLKEMRLKKKLKIKQRLEKIKLKRQEKRQKQQKNEIIAVASPTKIRKIDMENTEESAKKAWEAPLEDGEVEYFVSSRKIATKAANAKLQEKEKPSTPKSILRGKSLGKATKVMASPHTPGSAKRVKIALNHNKIQKPSDYLKQIKNSPDVPYDADKKPGKGLLKANAMPSPVDPFYMKRQGLKLKLSL